MKRLLIILLSFSLPIMASAQLKVAILETVDKAQDVSYGVKLLLRSSLTSAISNTPGYEGYDRVDMASIAGEQEFQRTGNVSDSQIKQLGAATGAQYVLVAEAAKYDEVSIIITAKLLDVETFGVKSSAVVVSGISANDMQQSCKSLASKLITISQNAPVVQTKTTAAPQAKVATTALPTVPVATPVTKKAEVPAEVNTGEIGSLYTFSDHTRGVIFYNNYGVGLVMSLDAVELPYSESRRDIEQIPNNENDGLSFIAGIGENYTLAMIRQLGHDGAPAAEWCAKHGDGWYLPSAGELVSMIEAISDKKIGKEIKSSLKKAGGNKWEEGEYWSSSECNASNAVKIDLLGSGVSEAKGNSLKVRAVRSFSY